MGRRKFIKIKYNMIQDKLKEIAKKYGIDNAVKAVGNMDRYLKIMWDGDINKYYQETQLSPYKLSDDGMTLYIDDLIVQIIGFKDVTFRAFKGAKSIGGFRYGNKDSLKKACLIKIYPIQMDNGQQMWRVAGIRCSLCQQSNGLVLYIDDDECVPIDCRTEFIQGFGYEGIKKRNELCLKHRTQIYNQIIERFNLNEDLNQMKI
jgi:hypothetical protein